MLDYVLDLFLKYVQLDIAPENKNNPNASQGEF